MRDLLLNIAGWVPAIIFPLATITQLSKVLKSKNVAGISVWSWFLFGVANVCLYIYTEKYLSIQSLLGLLGTAIFDFTIVVLYFRYKGNE